MDQEKERGTVYPIWVDWDRRIISFSEADGFEKLEYPTHEEMFAFAVEKGFEGFGIQ